jgi:hypothetical protein
MSVSSPQMFGSSSPLKHAKLSLSHCKRRYEYSALLAKLIGHVETPYNVIPQKQMLVHGSYLLPLTRNHVLHPVTPCLPDFPLPGSKR